MNDKKRLKELESKISRSPKQFLETGRILKTIRDERLYKQGYGNFKEYCSIHLELNYNRANRWVIASEIHTELETFGNQIVLPDKESQFRALNDIKDKVLRIKVLRHLSDSGGKLNANKITETAKLLAPENIPKPTNWIRITKDEIELAYFHILLDPDQPKVQDFYIKMALTLEKGGSVVMVLYPSQQKD